MSRSPCSPLVAATLCALLGACGGDNLSLPDLSEPARLEAVSGTGQAGSVGTLLAEPLVVRVLDSEDHPVSKVKVTFRPGTGAAGSTVQPDTVESDGDGRASVRWALGGSAGGQTLVASVVGNSQVSASFSAMAGAGQASQLELISGDSQSATAGSQLADSLIVRTLDATGQPVAGIVVDWAVTGGGSVSASTTVSRADGRTGVRRTLGPAAGEQTTTASLADQDSVEVRFTSSATVGAAGALRVEVQPASSARSGQAFSQQPQLQLIDENGNMVAQNGLAVSARIGSGPAGATLIGSTTASTNAQGLAVFTNLGISGPGGSYTLDFSGPGASGVTSAAIAMSAGEAVKLAMVTQPPTSAKDGAVLSPAPVVQLEDASGNRVARSGVPLTVSLTGVGTLAGTLTVSTDGNGRATFGDLAISGASGDCTLLFAGNGLQSVASRAVHLASTPSSEQSSIDAPASAEAGASATVRVTVRDRSASVLGGISVTLSASGSDNDIAPVSAITGSDGVATFSFSSTRAETKSLSAKADGVTVRPETLDVVPADGSPSHTTADVPDGETFETTRMTVEVADLFGNHLTEGGADVAGAIVDGVNQTWSRIEVADNQDGTYTLTYTPYLRGTDQIGITLGGTPIQGSPFRSRVSD